MIIFTDVERNSSNLKFIMFLNVSIRNHFQISFDILLILSKLYLFVLLKGF